MILPFFFSEILLTVCVSEFSNSGVHYNPLGGLLRLRSLGPIFRVSDSVFLGGAQ